MATDGGGVDREDSTMVTTLETVCVCGMLASMGRLIATPVAAIALPSPDFTMVALNPRPTHRASQTGLGMAHNEKNCSLQENRHPLAA